MINGIKIEVCCGSIIDCQRALSFPIDRIELNSALELGGLTPSISTLRKVSKLAVVPICCMVRNRGGSFVYNDEEFDLMLQDGKLLLDNGADGLVFGCLNADNSINVKQTKRLVELCKEYGKQAIFHKAFDQTDMLESIKVLIELGIDRVLTSGGDNYPDILKGKDILRKLNEKYNDKIEILPGGGVRKENVVSLLKETKITQVHMSASTIKDGFQQLYKDKLQGILETISKY